MVRNRDSNFEREIAVFSYPQAGVVTGGKDFVSEWPGQVYLIELSLIIYDTSEILISNNKLFAKYKFTMIFHIVLS